MTFYFYLSKFFWFVFSPLNLIIIFFILGFFFNIIKIKFLSKFFYIFSFIFFFISAILPTGSYLNFLLEKKFHSFNSLPTNIDGILILGGATNPLLTLEFGQVSLHGSVERLTESIKLIKKFPYAKVIFAGGSGSIKHPKLDHAEVVKKFFKEMGVDANNIIYEKKSRNTYENIFYAKNIINPKKNEKWLLVTSAFHLHRALSVAEKLKWNFIPYPTDFSMLKDYDWTHHYGFFNNISRFHEATYEWLGIIYYYYTGRSARIF